MCPTHTSGPYISAITTGSNNHSFSLGHLTLPTYNKLDCNRRISSYRLLKTPLCKELLIFLQLFTSLMKRMYTNVYKIKSKLPCGYQWWAHLLQYCLTYGFIGHTNTDIFPWCVFGICRPVPYTMFRQFFGCSKDESILLHKKLCYRPNFRNLEDHKHHVLAIQWNIIYRQ